jgi:hypothetical protein
MSVIFEPSGGLGNQLFVYALAKELQTRLNINIFFRLSYFDINSNFKYELDSFKDGNSIGVVDKIPFRYIYDTKFFNTAMNKYPMLRHIKLPNIFIEKNMKYSHEIFKIIDKSIVRGLFQSWKYFENSKDLIKHNIRELIWESDWFKTKQKELKTRGNFTAIHIRGGDYRTTPSLGILKNNYYERAIKVLKDMRKMYSNPVIFTNDNSILDDFSFMKIETNNIIIAPSESRPIESLILMSMAESIIIANSTFSWWSAYLSSASTVIAPRPWLSDAHHNDRDLILLNWLTVGRG